MMQTDCVRNTTLIVLRRHDPDLASKLGGNFLEDSKSGCIDAIVVGEQDAIEQVNISDRQMKFRPPLSWMV
jgi:hypothetical protein